MERYRDLLGVAPMQEHALEYFTAPEHGDAYAGMLEALMVAGQHVSGEPTLRRMPTTIYLP